MKTSLNEIINDLISKPGLGMFAWMCLVFFAIAFIFFFWALKSGQLDDLEKSKYDMLEDHPKKEANKHD